MRPLERKLKALANERRLTMLGLLKRQRRASVGQVASALHLSFAATSHHLLRLESAGILEREMRGLFRFYLISKSLPGYIEELIDIL